MDRLKRDAILIRLIQLLRHHGSWCGETHVQKATYLLQGLTGAGTGFDFILYKHGPFSFDLSDELSAMRADGLVSVRVQQPGYGPSIVAEPAADELLRRFPRTISVQRRRIEFVATKLGSKAVVELERLATALFVAEQLGEEADDSAVAARVHRLKPHVPEDAACGAVRTIRGWRQEARAEGFVAT